jgi:DNA-binding transcriptional LysR family regulator
MLDLLDVRKLRVLREVAARGTIAAAADALGMTPSAASQQLAALERQAGNVELVVRTGRSVKLTPAGTRLVSHTERVLEHLEAARVDLQMDSDALSGELHVAAFGTAIRHLLAPALVELRASHPALDVGVIEEDTEPALAALLTGTIDLALTYDYDLLPTTAPVGAEFDLLLEEPMHLVVPERRAGDGSPVELATMAGERWIAPCQGTSCNTFVQRACNQAGFTPEFWALSSDFAAITQLVAADVGVALVPALGCIVLPAGAVRLELAAPRMHRRIHAAVRTGNRDNPGVRAVVEHVRRAAKLAQLEVAAELPARGATPAR